MKNICFAVVVLLTGAAMLIAQGDQHVFNKGFPLKQSLRSVSIPLGSFVDESTGNTVSGAIGGASPWLHTGGPMAIVWDVRGGEACTTLVVNAIDIPSDYSVAGEFVLRVSQPNITPGALEEIRLMLLVNGSNCPLEMRPDADTYHVLADQAGNHTLRFPLPQNCKPGDAVTFWISQSNIQANNDIWLLGVSLEYPG